MFRAWSNPWPAVGVVYNSTVLHTVLEDGTDIRDRLYGTPPKPNYYKFYIDNMCKRVIISMQAMEWLVFELFVSSEVKDPAWTRYMKMRRNEANKKLYIEIDAEDPSFKALNINEELTQFDLLWCRWAGSTSKCR